MALKNICVKVASGAKVMCTQMWKNFKCKMQGKWFHIDVYILTLGSYDVILDAQWLYELGNIYGRNLCLMVRNFKLRRNLSCILYSLLPLYFFWILPSEKIILVTFIDFMQSVFNLIKERF